jgi:hypothetical protein
MMTKTTNKSRAVILKMASLPIIAGLIVFMSVKTIAQETAVPKAHTTAASQQAIGDGDGRHAEYFKGVQILINDKANNIFIDKPYEKLTEAQKDKYLPAAPKLDNKGTNRHYPGKIFEMNIIGEFKDGKLVAGQASGKTIDKSPSVVNNDDDLTMPEFPGGIEAFGQYVNENVNVPDGAHGSFEIYVSFIVEKDGSVSTVKVSKGENQRLNKEVVRVIQLSQKWSPGKKEGKPVKVSNMFPITINL